MCVKHPVGPANDSKDAANAVKGKPNPSHAEQSSGGEQRSSKDTQTRRFIKSLRRETSDFILQKLFLLSQYVTD